MDKTVEILNGLAEIYGSPFLSNLKRAVRNYPDANFSDALSLGQVKSKKWLIETLEEMNLELGVIFLLGGWYAILASMMFESPILKIEKIRSFDIDPSCANIADTMNRMPWVLDNSWQFKASTADMYNMDYSYTKYTTARADGSLVPLEESPDTIINTSCEHLEFFDRWWNKIPENKLVILQSNNFVTSKDHINCVHTLDDFKFSAPMNKILFEGALELEEYTRFMLIGKK